MHLELSPDEARFLDEHLGRHRAEMERELVRTDKRELQRDLARETELLRTIHERLRSALFGEPGRS